MKIILNDWGHAYFLHSEGFHEARLGIEYVEARVKHVAELFEMTKAALKEHEEN